MVVVDDSAVETIAAAGREATDDSAAETIAAAGRAATDDLAADMAIIKGDIEDLRIAIFVKDLSIGLDKISSIRHLPLT